MHKPTAEDEYFARENAEKLRKLAADQRAGLAESEKARLRELHHKHCPNCGMEMGEVPFNGLKIARCFACNGTFLTAADFSRLAHENHGSLMADVLRIFEHKHTL